MIEPSSRGIIPVETISTQQAFEIDNNRTRDRDWLSPISMSKLKLAVEKKAKTVELNGRMYNIEYGHVLNMRLTGKRECVKLRRVDGGKVPFGYVSLDRLARFEFEEK